MATRNQTQRTILLIDDDTNIRKMTRLRLERAGYRVATAARGELGLSMARIEHPDLIILDVLMPLMDGREVLKRLKADPETRDVPVGLLTVVTTDEQMSEPIPPGAAFYLTKPYDSDELLQKVEVALSKRSQR